MGNNAAWLDGELAQARSAAYGLLGGALRYPERELLGTLNEPARWTCWPAALGHCYAELADSLMPVRGRLTQLSLNSPHGGADLGQLQEVFVRLFGHTVRGTCPPYELEYGRSHIHLQAAELADIAGFYAAFGMELAAGANERADHVAVECEFMSVLAAKEAHAIATGDTEGLEVLRGAQRSFLRDHLGRWLPAFARRISEADGDGLYGALGRFAGAFVAAECGRLNVACGPGYLELRPIDTPADQTMTCGPVPHSPGRTEALVQIGISPAGR